MYPVEKRIRKENWHIILLRKFFILLIRKGVVALTLEITMNLVEDYYV